MGKFVKDILAFVCYCVAVYIVFLMLWGKLLPGLLGPNLRDFKGGYGHTYSRLKEAHNYGEVDVLFLGSSHSYRGFDPRVFSKRGINTFNLGSSAQTPLQSEMLLRKYYSSLKPKRVVFEMYPSNFSSDGVESSLDIVSNCNNDIESFKMVLRTNHLKVYNSWLFNILNESIFGDEGFIEPVSKAEDTYVSGGYVEREMEFGSNLVYDSVIIKFNEIQTSAFHRLVTFCEEKDMELILVFAPITSYNYNAIGNMESVDSLMDVGKVYIDFNGKVDLDDSLHFYDAHHLNQKGVELFNQEMVNFLKE